MRKELKFYCFLILLCSTGLTAFTTSADSLRPLAPRGVILTPEAFRLVLDERVRLNECLEKSSNKDSALFNLGKSNGRLQGENLQLRANETTLRANESLLKENNKVLQKALFRTSISSGVGWGLALVLAVKILFF